MKLKEAGADKVAETRRHESEHNKIAETEVQDLTLIWRTLTMDMENIDPTFAF